jgi:drug/metabolite transporter (DMT)-like permease
MEWLIGAGSMTMAILTNALSGPAFKYIENHNIQPSLAAAWRGHCMLFFLVPIAFLEYLQTGTYIQYFARKPELPYPIYVHVLFAGLGWSGTLLFWINGLNFISTVQASLFVNLHPLFMVLYLYFTGSTLTIYDWCGVFLAVSGMIIISAEDLYHELVDPSEDTQNLSNQIFGSCLCLLAACSEFTVIVNRKKIKKYVPLMQVTSLLILLLC